MPGASRTTPLAFVTVGAVVVIAGLLSLDVVGGLAYTAAVAAIAAAGAIVLAGRSGSDVAWLRGRVDLQDLVAVVGLYALIVAGFRLAFTVFTVANTWGLFLSFATALLLGFIAPIVYTVWVRQRPLASLGIGFGNWRATLSLALIFAGVQFAMTLPLVEYPQPEIWLPLLVMALAVGAFESVFFRGFIQNRLEASFGLAPAVAVAAGLYGLYHVGYGMGPQEIGFLVGLGIVYAVAFRVAGSLLVLWPLLTPLGSLFSQLQASELVLPLESIFGFADILGLMVAAIWLAVRQERRLQMGSGTSRVGGAGRAAPVRTRLSTR
jgi:membrane protease YdiL (CAAX protease family)